MELELTSYFTLALANVFKGLLDPLLFLLWGVYMAVCRPIVWPLAMDEVVGLGPF